MSAAPTTSAEKLDPPLPLSSLPRAPAWMLALVLLATLAALWPVVRGGLVWDDLETVARNPRITGLAHLPELFSKPMWDSPSANPAAHVGYWRPLAGVALLVAHRLGHGQPLWFHLISLALHLAATAVAFRLALRLTRSVPAALFASLLFGLHPVHVESVAWISAINDPLFGLFGLLALNSFVAWRDRGSPGAPWTSALWFALAMLSKELAASVVLIALAIDWARSRASDRPSNSPSWMRAYAPFAAVLAAWYLARVAVFASPLAGLDSTSVEFGVGPQRLALLRVELLGGFLGLLAWPFHLSLFRAMQPSLAFGDPIVWRALLAIIVLAAAIGFACSRRAIAILCAALFVPAALLPLLVRVQALGRYPLSDRYLYLAVLGFTLLLALALLRALPTRVACALLALVAFVYGVRSFQRTAVWRDEESLFTAAAADDPKSPFVQVALGRVLLQKYRVEKTGDNLRRAHEAFERALDLLSAAQAGDGTIFATVEDHVQANLGYGWSFLYEAEVDEGHDFKAATEVFKRVADRYPLNAEAWTSLGVAYSQMNELADSKKAFEKALEIEPDSSEAYRGLGLLELQQGHLADASKHFERALALRPDSLEDALLLAGALGDGGETARAREIAESARASHPRDAGPLALLGTLAAQKGDIEGAAAFAARALELSPNDGKALLLRGKVQLARQEFAGALRTLQRAADILTTNFEAHYNVAALFLRENNLSAAMPYLLRAYDCRPPGASGDLLRATIVKMELKDVDVLLKLAAIDAQHGRDAQALEWVEKALALKPDYGPAHFIKGGLARKRGDLETAAAEWRKASAAMPDSAAINESLGMLLYDMKQPDEAVKYLEKALAVATQAPAPDELQRGAIEMLRQTIERVKSAKH